MLRTGTNSLDFDGINQMALRCPQELIRASEEDFAHQLEQVARDILAHSEAKIIFLAGPSSSGKTSTAQLLCTRLCEGGQCCHVISTDNFFIDSDRYPKLPDGSPNFDSFECLDLPLIRKCMTEVTQTGRTMLPAFDFAAGKQLLDQTPLQVGPHDHIIIEGIHSLNPRMHAGLSPERFYRVYVNVRSTIYREEEIILTPQDIRLTRRMIRDSAFRGYPASMTLSKWWSILAAEQVNIIPYRRQVEGVIDSTMWYEPCLYSHFLKRVEESGEVQDEQEKSKLDDLLRRAERFHPIPLEEVPSGALTGEFFGI